MRKRSALSCLLLFKNAVESYPNPKNSPASASRSSFAHVPFGSGGRVLRAQASELRICRLRFFSDRATCPQDARFDQKICAKPAPLADGARKNGSGANGRLADEKRALESSDDRTRIERRAPTSARVREQETKSVLPNGAPAIADYTVFGLLPRARCAYLPQLAL